MWQKLKPEKPNITIIMILKPSVVIMVETHYEIHTTIIYILDNQMVVIQVQVGKNIVEDVLLDRRASVNIITKNRKTKLNLPKPRPVPYRFRMVDHSMIKPLGIIRNLKIHIHGIPYVATFTVLQNNVVNFNYSLLLGRFWLIDAKVTHD
jgi:hypothetical protein